MPRARYSSLRFGQRGRITSLCRPQLQQLVRRRHYVRLRKGHHARHLGDVRLTVGKKCCRDHRRAGKDFCRRTENVTEILYGERARLPDFSESRARIISENNFSSSACKARGCGFQKSAKKVSGRCPDKPHRRDFLPRDALLAAICLPLKGRMEQYAAERIGQAGGYRSARWMLCTLIPPERGTGRSRSGLSCRSRSD